MRFWASSSEKYRYLVSALEQKLKAARLNFIWQYYNKMSKAVLNEQNQAHSTLPQKLKYNRHPELDKVKMALSEALDENDEVDEY